jgi:hypothetical protein
MTPQCPVGRNVSGSRMKDRAVACGRGRSAWGCFSSRPLCLSGRRSDRFAERPYQEEQRGALLGFRPDLSTLAKPHTEGRFEVRTRLFVPPNALQRLRL